MHFANVALRCLFAEWMPRIWQISVWMVWGNWVVLVFDTYQYTYVICSTYGICVTYGWVVKCISMLDKSTFVAMVLVNTRPPGDILIVFFELQKWGVRWSGHWMGRQLLVVVVVVVVTPRPPGDPLAPSIHRLGPQCQHQLGPKQPFLVVTHRQ